MTESRLEVVRIGESRGVRLPAEVLRRYRIGDTVIMEQRADGIFLRAAGSGTTRLSWEATARAIANVAEDWSAWDVADADGLEVVPWDTGDAPVAERAASGHHGKRESGRRGRKR